MPITAIFSRRDGVVAWRACLDRSAPAAENVEVRSTHLGLGLDPDVWETVARRLAIASRHRVASSSRPAGAVPTGSPQTRAAWLSVTGSREAPWLHVERAPRSGSRRRHAPALPPPCRVVPHNASMSDLNRLAVLIDADNTSAKLVKELFDELASYGTITVKRAYGDWTSPQLSGWREALLGNAISPKQQFAYTVGKNATDSALIIDAMDLLYSGNVEGFAIVSSDSDFTPLATRLRESGKRVIGVGQRKTPKAFVEACEKFVYVEVLGDSSERERNSTPEPGEPPGSLHSMLSKALNRVPTDDEDWASLSALGAHLNRTDPSFDPRTYEFTRLSDLVKAQHYLETKTVTSAGGQGQLWVRLKGRRGSGQGTKATAQKSASTKKSAATKAAKKPAT